MTETHAPFEGPRDRTRTPEAKLATRTRNAARRAKYAGAL